MLKKALFIFFGFLVLSSCSRFNNFVSKNNPDAYPTRYVPSMYDKAGGYSDLRVSPTNFIIRSSCNRVTIPDICRNIALLRSAEIAMINGYKYFEIIGVDGGISKSTQYYQSEDRLMKIENDRQDQLYRNNIEMRIRLTNTKYDDRHYESKVIIDQLYNKFVPNFSCLERKNGFMAQEYLSWNYSCLRKNGFPINDGDYGDYMKYFEQVAENKRRSNN